MRKKISLLAMIVGLALTSIACGNNEQLDKNDSTLEENRLEFESGKEEVDTTKSIYNQTFLFMGYNIGYPEKIDLSTTDYGKIFEYEECCVIVEAPSEAGIMIDLQNVNEVPGECQEYLFNTLEGTIRSLFVFDQTEQVIENSSVVTINEIEMLRVKGVFKNIEENTSIPYIGYYFLGGPDSNRPVYTIGIALDENADVERFMDEFAKQIKK